MPVAELARRAGVTVRTIRYYVAEGLLPPPSGAGPRRLYTRDHLLQLEAIRRLKERYLPLAEIRRTLAGRSAEEVRALLADLSGGEPRVEAVGSTWASPPALDRPTVVARLGQEERRAPRPIGRIEAPDTPTGGAPSESTWRRVYLAPDVELHFRPSADLARSAAIRRLVEEAARLLTGRPEERRGSGD